MRPCALVELPLLLLIVLPLHPAKSSSGTIPDLLFTSAPAINVLAWTKGGERFPSGASVQVRDHGGQRPLLPAFAASADPALSFDAKTALVAARRATSDSWQIWEVPLAGGEPTQITKCATDCVRPFYLPDGRFVYAEKDNSQFVIWAADLAGGVPVRLTFGSASAMPTDILGDGRVLFETVTSSGPELYTVYADGSGVESYRCDHGKPRFGGHQIDSNDIVFTDGRRLARFTSAMAKEVAVPAPQGEYAGNIAAIGAGEWLLSWRPNQQSDFRLMRWRVGQNDLQSVVVMKGASAVEAVPIREVPPPKKHPSGLHDWATGNLLCLNAYTSKSKFAPDSIRAVRLYTEAEDGSVRVLGEAPVEPDGSFFIQVPGDKPLQIELLDRAGKTLKRETGWYWMRRGEQRVCVGCHAGPETAPENAIPLVLQKSTAAADLTGNHATTGGH